MKFNKWLILASVVPLVYVLGPRVKHDSVTWKSNKKEIPLQEAEAILKKEELHISDLKPGNESRIIWFRDSIKEKTSRVVVYLHGFSASPMEGQELATAFGKRYGCNVFLPRLADHGRSSPDSFEELTPSQYVQSAQDAIDFARNLGDSIVVFSCSTGSTLGLILAAHGEKFHSHFMYSPNIQIADPSAPFLLWPWGKQIGTLVLGGNYNVLDYPEEQKKYWNSKYHIHGILTLQRLLSTYMNAELFQKIDHPVFMGYYYKDENHQDDVVSVEAMQDMFTELRTPDRLKAAVAFPAAGSHMMISSLFSKQMPLITGKTFEYAEGVLGFMPIQATHLQ